MVLRTHGLPAVTSGGVAAFIGMSALTLLAATPAFAQDATPLPGIVVDAGKPPPPISVPSADDPGPAAQARPPRPQASPIISVTDPTAPPATTVAQNQQAPAPGAVTPQQAPVPSDGTTGQSQTGELGAPLVVTPNRNPEQIGNVGSAVTVIGPAQIQRARAGGASVTDLLRGTPGVVVRRNGGIGAGADVSIRGADSDQTLVMIDGVPLNDPASAQGEFDFSVISLANVARIEILRGPQSGVYGGDAIGGVINIVTNKGRGKPSAFAEVEGGSFGTVAQRAGATGTVGRFSYALGVSNFYSNGFSRRSDDDEDDSTTKQAASLSLGYAVSRTTSLEARLGYYRLRAEIDQLSDSRSDAGNTFDRDLLDAAVTVRNSAFGGLVTTKATLFANQTERAVRECRDLNCADVSNTDFLGTRAGGEVNATVLTRGRRDALTVGGRWSAVSGERVDSRTGRTVSRSFDAEETHRALYASYAFNPFKALTVTTSGRLDDFDTGDFDGTYRVAAAYRISQTGTKFRASYGTGLKAPTIFQRFDVTFGNDTLDVEKSRGFDVGVDQSFFNGAFEISATYFETDITDLIVFTGDFFTGTYENVDEVETKGVELAGEWRPLGWLRVRATYTHLDATDATTGARLRRRPEDVAKGTVAIEPFSGLYIAATVLHQSYHFNRAFDPDNPDADRERVKGFTRLDFNADYRVTDNATIFLRAENVTDVDYEEVRGFNTPDRSAYVGVRIRF